MSETAAAPLGTVLTAMATPFTDSGELDLDSARALAKYLIDSGNDGLVLSGTTGESPTTSDAEQAALLRVVIDEVGDRATIIAGVGTNDTQHSINLAHQAADAGADGLLLVTPYYNKPPQASLRAHFVAVADATALPVMVYDIPGRCGIRIGTPLLQELAQHERIVAVKDATGDLVAGLEVMGSTSLAYYSGDDALNLAWLAVGAVGVVSVVGHVAAAHYAEMVQAVAGGDLPRARGIHQRLGPVVDTIMSPKSQGAIRAKAAMYLRGVIASSATRMPLLPATDAELAEVRKILDL